MASTSKPSGFTLIELMVTVTIAAILATVAMPSLRAFIARGQIASATNELSATLQFARSQAVARNRCVTICRSADTANLMATTPTVPTCATSGTNWDSGWLVFEDTTCGASTNPATVDDVLRVRHGQSDGVTITAQSVQRVVFDGRGSTGMSTPQRFQVVPTEGSSNTNARSLCLGSAGRVVIQTLTSGNCPAGS